MMMTKAVELVGAVLMVLRVVLMEQAMAGLRFCNGRKQAGFAQWRELRRRASGWIRHGERCNEEAKNEGLGNER